MFRGGVTGILFGVASGCLMAAGDLGGELQSGSLWKLPRRELSNKYLVGEKFAPVDASSFRLLSRGRVTIGGLKPREIVMAWKEDLLDSMLVMVYNKGDDGTIDRESYEGKVEATVEALDALTGQKGKLKRVSKKESAVDVKAWEWVWPGGAMRLEASSSGKRRNFTAEFIRLTIGPDMEALERGGANDAANRSDLKEHVKKEEGGPVWIDGIPMVDQGEKGYCLPAAVSRVFAYYGMDGVDQHALAALCGSSGEGGTSSRAMLGALKKIGSKFHVRIIELDDIESAFTWMGDYDKFAKKLKKTPLRSSGFLDAWDVADGSVLRAVRAGKPSQIEKWMKPIRKSISQGIPVLWSVTLGVFSEEVGLPQSRGGHMRLIIGYDDAKKTVLFTDTWGAGHEKKEMPVADAAAMTMQRYLLKPSR